MGKKCPPGVICVENCTLFFIILLILFFIYFYIKTNNIYYNFNTNTSNGTFPEKVIKNEITIRKNETSDSLINPYFPPLQSGVYRRGVPINVRTSGINTTFQQIGILTRVNGPETILPLMGRPLHTNRNKWQFYTMSDKHYSVKLPISNAGKSCMEEYGCDNLSNGDSVYIQGYNDIFEVTLYNNYLPQYIPYI